MSKEKNKTTEVYQLDPNGKTYQSAMTLHRIYNRNYALNPIPQIGRNLAEIGSDFAAFYKRFYMKMVEKKPDLLQDTGIMSPATQVKTYDDGFPRAYLSYPVIYISDHQDKNGKDILYLYAPIDYKGSHFVPEGGKKLNEKEAEKVGHIIGGGGWGTPNPVFPMQDIGVATPGDFDAKIHYSINASLKPNHTTVCFIAQGRSLEITEDLERRKKEWKDACDTVTKMVGQAAPSSYGQNALALIAAGEEFYVNSSQSYGGNLGSKTDFRISVRQKGNLDIMHGGQPTQLVDNQHFLVEAIGYGDYRIKPNISTPEGIALKKLFDAVPPVPYQTDYPELLGNFPLTQDNIDKMLGIDGATPRIQNLAGTTLLIYNCDAGVKSDFCPPGARPLDTSLRVWLDKDESDKNMNIQPPPMPKELISKFIELFGEPRQIEANRSLRLPAPAAKPATPE